MKNVRRQWQEVRTTIERWLDKFCSTMDVVIEYSYVFLVMSAVYLVYECNRLQRNIHLQDAALTELDRSLNHLMKMKAELEMDTYKKNNNNNNNKKKKKKKIETEIENLYSEKNVIKKDDKDQDIMIGKSIKNSIDMNSGVTRKASHNKKNKKNENTNNDKHHNDSIPTYEYIELESFVVFFDLVYTLPPTTQSF
eukprot:CAMPEP_0178968646 /NCGR_PEP_ID=MMETSP0789-20121207/18384_1 /TAXON_ID=3005 /ORGANISM="Rhizosolenia setigera, Strain CCMP 1694" /LENGTH=194 /DNA_ID=CAMNT_0020654627 /DNA_START=16 /DNA_END=600 /DNA_ORIENTATION=+